MDRVDFQYNSNAKSLTTGTGTNADVMDYAARLYWQEAAAVHIK
jgi:hypothetical protein